MRRLLTLVLLAAFVLPIAAPLLALGQDTDANLPACCRRHGKHHCTMTLATHGNAPQIIAVCPCYQPGIAVQPSSLQLAVFSSAPRIALASQFPAPISESAAHHGTRDRSRSTRGPPARLLL